MKYNAVNMFKEISKHTNKYLNDDVKEWIYKKADDVKEWIYKSLAIFRTLKRFRKRCLGHIEHYETNLFIIILLLFIQNRRNNKLKQNSCMVPTKSLIYKIK